MSDRTHPLPDERPSLTPDRNVEAAVRDSFPASDPPAPTAAQGVRAADPEALARDDAGPPATPWDAVRLTQTFPSLEAAKLALETLVREGPIDRRCAEIRHDGPGGGAMLELTVPQADRSRLEALLRREAGPASGPA